MARATARMAKSVRSGETEESGIASEKRCAWFSKVWGRLLFCVKASK